jgi:hypothetical protein
LVAEQEFVLVSLGERLLDVVIGGGDLIEGGIACPRGSSTAEMASENPGPPALQASSRKWRRK